MNVRNLVSRLGASHRARRRESTMRPLRCIAHTAATFALAAALCAPAITARAATRQFHPVCLIGQWTATDMTAFLGSIINRAIVSPPATSATDVSLYHVTGVSGALNATFRDDNTGGLNLAGLTVAADLNGHAVQVTFNGVEPFNYQDNGDGTITFLNPASSIFAGAVVDGIPVANGIEVSDLCDLQNTATWTYNCDGDALSMQPAAGTALPATTSLRFARR
jgi:hypothetical protein